jgi:hypothetical protein
MSRPGNGNTPPPSVIPAPRVSLPYQPYGFKETRGKSQPTRITRSRQATWGDPVRAGNATNALSSPLQLLLAPSSYNSPWWAPQGISEQLIYQPDPMLMFGTGALFNFAQLDPIPGIVNLLSNPDLWVNMVGNVVTADQNILPLGNAPGYIGVSPVSSGNNWYLPYACMPYIYVVQAASNYSLAFLGQQAFATPWLNTASQISFQLYDYDSPAGSTVQVYLSATYDLCGNLVLPNSPDWTYVSGVTSEPTSAGPSDEPNANVGDDYGTEYKASYTSRLLTPTDNPVIVFTGGGQSGGAEANFTLVPIYPRQAVSPVSALGSGSPFDTTGWNDEIAGWNGFVLGNICAERTAGCIPTNVYAPDMEGVYAINSGASPDNDFVSEVSARDYPGASGYAICDGTVDPTNHLMAGVNILAYPNDWVQLGSVPNFEAVSAVLSWDPLKGIYSKLGLYNNVYNPQASYDVSGNPATPYSWGIQYNQAATAGAVLAFTVGVDQTFGGLQEGQTYTVNMYLSGNLGNSPDWTVTLTIDGVSGANTQSATYTSPALAAGDRPIVQIIPGSGTFLGSPEVYLIPNTTMMTAAQIGPLPQIRMNSIMNSVLGMYSPPNISGGTQYGQPAHQGQSYMYSGQTQPWNSWYFGTTLYYVPTYVGGSLTDTCGNNLSSLNGSFFHVGMNDGGASFDSYGNLQYESIANGNALIAFGVSEGCFAAWTCDAQVLDTTQMVTEGWVTLGAVLTVFDYYSQSTGTTTGVKIEFYVNGQFIGEAVTNGTNAITGVQSGSWTSLFEGFGNLPSYSQSDSPELGGFVPTRFYMENLSITQRKGSFVAYNDYFIGQTPVGPGRTVLSAN